MRNKIGVKEFFCITVFCIFALTSFLHGTSPEFAYFVAYGSTKLLAEELPPGTSLGNPAKDNKNFDSHYPWACNTDSQFVKDDFLGKCKTMVDLKENQSHTALAEWYALVASKWAEMGINFGNPSRNSTDKSAHENWAKSKLVSKKEIYDQIKQRVEIVYNHPDLGANVIKPIPAKNTALSLKIVSFGFLFDTKSQYSRYADAATYPGLPNITRALGRLPLKFKNVFKIKGKLSTIEINNQMKWALWGWGNVSGRSYNKKIAVPDSGIAERSFYHELAHLIHYDAIQGTHPSFSTFNTELNQLLDKNIRNYRAGERKPGYVTDYASSNPDDEFAESFTEYQFNQQGFLQLANQDLRKGVDRLMKMYNFIDKLYR